MLGKVIRKTSAGGGKGFGDVVRYVARDRDDQIALRERFGAPDMGTINLDCPLDAHEDRISAIAILDSTAAAVQARRQTGHPAYHIEFSWKEGEHPTRQQVAQAASHVMRSVGMAEHQAIWAIHKDTDNDHVHLVVNRVHPDTHRIQKVPGWDWLKLDKAMREIEGVQGWRHDNGPWIAVQRERPGQTPALDIVRMSRTERAQRGLLKDPEMRVTDKAYRAEQNIGADAFQRWVAGSPGRTIKATLANPGATWETVHQAAAQYGCLIQPKGSGMIVATTLDDGRVLAAKASQLGRWASKAELEKKLGPYQPPNARQIEPSLTYQCALDGGKGQLHGPSVRGDRADRTDRRLERQAARKDLAERFKQEQAALRARRPALRKALTERHRAERQMLTAELRRMRATAIAGHKRDGMLPQVAISYQAWIAAARREELQKRQAAERKEIAAKVPRAQVWRTWLEQQAKQGDEAAQAALRGIRYREQRKSKAYPQQDGIEGEELDPLRKLTVAALHAEIDHKRQLVIYRGKDDREKFTDTGPRIVMHDKADDSLEAALRIAAQKYGGKVAITGSSEFRERAARQAVRLGITVTDDDLQAIVADAQTKQERAAAKPPVSAPAHPASRPGSFSPMAGQGILGRLPSEGWRALEAAGRGTPLSAKERAVLTDPARPVLVDGRDRLTELGRGAYESMREMMARERGHESGAGVSTEPLGKSAPAPTQAAPEQAWPALPEKQATAPAPTSPFSKPPRVQRPDPPTDVLKRWWNPKGDAERSAWSDLSEQRGGGRGAWGAWHAMRDYVEAETDVPASIAQAKASDRQRGRGR